ncbi:hypothetical protein ZWY2020_057866 [Hordeum vulgare]|nr:hypothetical protein ZWY2020_057866 [Hordeum vulgare]
MRRPSGSTTSSVPERDLSSASAAAPTRPGPSAMSRIHGMRRRGWRREGDGERSREEGRWEGRGRGGGGTERRGAGGSARGVGVGVGMPSEREERRGGVLRGAVSFYTWDRMDNRNPAASPLDTGEHSPVKDTTNTPTHIHGNENPTCVIMGDQNSKGAQSWYARLTDEKRAEYNQKRRAIYREKKAATSNRVNHEQMSQVDASSLLQPWGVLDIRPGMSMLGGRSEMLKGGIDKLESTQSEENQMLNPPSIVSAMDEDSHIDWLHIAYS